MCFHERGGGGKIFHAAWTNEGEQNRIEKKRIEKKRKENEKRNGEGGSEEYVQ